MTGFSEDPGTPYQARLTKPEFFARLARHEGPRCELKDGHIVMHAGSTKRHAGLSMNFAIQLARLVASQEEPIVWVCQREGEARALPRLPREIAGREDAIDLASLGISLPLAHIYRGIGS
jgi:hypothetical protein